MLCLYRIMTDEGYFICKHKDNFGHKCGSVKVFICSMKELLDAQARNSRNVGCYGKS